MIFKLISYSREQKVGEEKIGLKEEFPPKYNVYVTISKNICCGLNVWPKLTWEPQRVGMRKWNLWGDA